MNARLAYILSVVLHPLVMPTLLFGIVFYQAPTAIANLELFNGAAKVGMLSLKLGLLILIFLQTFLVPALTIYFVYRLGYIKTLDMQTLRDRRLPYLLTVIIYTIITAFYTKSIRQFPEVAVLMSSITFSIAIVSFISLYWKISAHAVGISGTIGAILGISIHFPEAHLFITLAVLILLAGFLLSARLQLAAHTLSQIIAGVALGLAISLSATLLLL
ncbi:hypothetical protein QM480_15495 [Flectobacillus sp. DC10W]|uniref:PAP2 superfamily protein n=1 Tax=Flectobacillus longus TaxID=2984207 RepID=A0ABT6YQ85_9BACT|nr:hypothetical protein [Flectobacillus longus]MDI9865748.1 hypothetical protein [Flectobacillus longus]